MLPSRFRRSVHRGFTATLRFLPAVRGRVRLFGDWASKHAGAFQDYTFPLARWTGLRWSTQGLPDLLTRHLLLTGIYQPEVLHAIQALLRPGCVAFDVGTHHGLMAVLMATQVGPSGKVHAFEPNPQVHTLIRHHAALNNVAEILRLEPIGIGATEGPMDFWAVPGTFAWNSSFTEAFAGGSDSVTVHRVPVRTLDAFCLGKNLAPSLIKIDVEGGELSVLQGASEILQRHRPAVLVEMNPVSSSAAGTTTQGIEELLLKHGYRGRILPSHPFSRNHLNSLQDYSAARHSTDKGLLNVAFLPHAE